MTKEFTACLERYIQKRKEEKSIIHRHFKKIYRKICGNNIKHKKYFIIGGYDQK